MALACGIAAGLAAPAAVPGCGTGAPSGAAQVRVDAPRYRVDLFSDDQALGGDHPLVTIVFFSDYACPPCKSMWALMKNLVEDYGPDLRVVWRTTSIPGYAQGERAADAALAAAAQGKFWLMHERLYQAFGQFDRATLRSHAEALGLDVPKFLDDFDTGVGAGVRLRHERQATRLGVRAVPVLFVNGLPMVGANLDEAAWHALIDAEIARAKERMAAGVRRDDLYAEILENAKPGPIPLGPKVRELAEKTRSAKAKKADGPAPVAVEGRRYDIGPGSMPLRGPADAPVVVVAFFDFQCPFCRRAHREALTKILAAHPRDVALALRHFPLEIHPAALGAAKASVAFARQGKFWAFVDRMMAHEGPVGRDRFVAWARDEGMDEQRFLRDFDDPAVAAEVERDIVLGKAVGVPSTPAFFVNGVFVRGYTPGALEAAVAKELSLARAELRKGTPRDRIAALLRGRGESVPLPGRRRGAEDGVPGASDRPSNPNPKKATKP